MDCCILMGLAGIAPAPSFAELVTKGSEGVFRESCGRLQDLVLGCYCDRIDEKLKHDLLGFVQSELVGSQSGLGCGCYELVHDSVC